MPRQIEITVGTTNKAKVDQIKGALRPLKNVVVKAVENKDLLPDVAEDGKTAQENAVKKAVAYAKALGVRVLSMDNALYFEKLPKNKQPGLHVRRINKGSERPTDSQMLEYYKNLVRKLGGKKIKGHWEFGICISETNGNYLETTIISPRIFTSSASKKIVEGYPLESIQIDPKTGKYISEMTEKEQEKFWQKAIGEKLCDFVEKSLE